MEGGLDSQFSIQILNFVKIRTAVRKLDIHKIIYGREMQKVPEEQGAPGNS